MQIIGREKEKRLLQEAFTSEKPEFIALYGRRRVGKTYLVKNFFENKHCAFIYVSGMKNGSYEQQLKNFCDGLKEVIFPGLEVPADWMEAFHLFTELIKKIELKKKIVLFLDELPWLATKKSKLLDALDYYWNRYWSHDSRVKLIVCGSAASWMLKKIIYNKGGLYNRITLQFRLEPFLLLETKQFLESNSIHLTHRQILEIYMITGGIPYYLTQIRKGLSAAQNIDELAFNKQGVLYQEFDRLFESLFDQADMYVNLIRIISEYRYGIGQEEILKKSEFTSTGGRAKEKLRDLEEAGFIMSFLPHEHKRKGIYYRLIDEYCYFYLKWIEPYKKHTQKFVKTSWASLRATSSWKAWSGYAFEVICLKHVNQIREALHLNPSCFAASWRYEGQKEERGAQIDLLFDRNDDAITICEIKYTDEPFKIDKEYFLTLKQKIELYKKVTRTRKQLFLAFVASTGIKSNLYSEENVSGCVTLEDLFH